MNKKIIKLAFALFLLFTGFFMVRSFILDDNLRNDKRITQGKIIDYELGYRGGIRFIYSFAINGREYRGKTIYPELVSNRPFDFINKNFPVIYLRNNVSYNEILVSRNSFKKYGIPFPDSLKWVIEFEK